MVQQLRNKAWFIVGNLCFIPAFMVGKPEMYIAASAGFAFLFVGIHLEVKKARSKQN